MLGGSKVSQADRKWVFSLYVMGGIKGHWDLMVLCFQRAGFSSALTLLYSPMDTKAWIRVILGFVSQHLSSVMQAWLELQRQRQWAEAKASFTLMGDFCLIWTIYSANIQASKAFKQLFYSYPTCRMYVHGHAKRTAQQCVRDP